MAVEIRVEARVLRERPESGIDTVELTLSHPRMKAADLIRMAVEEQVRTLTARRHLTAAEIQERLARQYASVVDGERREVAINVPEVNVAREVERALEACRKGQCILVVGGRPVEDLNEEIALEPETRVQFLRLLPLAGG